jgi:hypothetical protein
MSDEKQARPSNLEKAADGVPTDPRSLAALAGMVNGEIGQLNANIIGSGSLNADKITPEVISKATGHPVRSSQPNTAPGAGSYSHQPVAEAHNIVTSAPGPSIRVDLTDIEKFKTRTSKSLATVKRKLTKLEKDISSLNDIVSFNHKNLKYKITTNNIDSICNNTDALLKIFLNELQSGSKDITIARV